jgi:hypothetical protein
MTELIGYSLIIHEATGRTDEADLATIEDCMRQDIFHSTLDWQTRPQLLEAATEALWIMLALGEIQPITDEERAMLPRLREVAAQQTVGMEA